MIVFLFQALLYFNCNKTTSVVFKGGDNMSKIKDVNKKVEKTIVEGYKKVEDTVVSGYKTVENTVVGSYKKVEDKFVDSFLREENETIEEAKKRIKKQDK